MNTIFKYAKGDRAIWLVVLLLSIISILVVYSAIVTLAYKHHDGNTFYYLFRHGMFLGLGLAIIYGIHKIKHNYFSRISQLALYVSIPLLLLTLVVGSNINNASRWLVIPVINQSFQTSDLAKLALIMYVARVLSLKQDEIKDFKKAFRFWLIASESTKPQACGINKGGCPLFFQGSLKPPIVIAIPQRALPGGGGRSNLPVNRKGLLLHFR